MIDWERANSIISGHQDLARERRRQGGGTLSARTIRACPLCYAHLMTVGIFIYAYSAFGPNVSDALDHDFFASLRSDSLVDETTGEQQMDETHVVVSFVTHSGEADAVIASSPLMHRCDSCRAPQTQCYTRTPERHYCGFRACYEFEHLFGGRTVYR